MSKKQVRSDGRYAVQVYLGTDENGKRKYKTVYGKTQKEAQKKADELRTQLGKGLDVSNKIKTFKDWSELFLSAQKSILTPSEYELKKSRVNYFYDFFGSSPIESIRPFQIESALNELAKENPTTGKPSAKKTITVYKQVCGQVFKFAIKNRVVEYNPAEYAELPKNLPQKERRALSSAEREWIATYSGENKRAKRAAMIAMFCGLRRGELTALTWNDINLIDKTVTINKSYNFKSNTVKLPKTTAGIRTVPMPEPLVEFLKSEKREGVNVLVTKNGKIMTETAWKRMLESFLVDLEIAHGIGKKKNKCAPEPTVFTIQPFGWHDLRHTYATILFEAGVDILTAQYLLGHASAKTTMEIYTHLSNEQKHRSIIKLNTFLTQNNNCKSNASQTG